MLVGKEIIREEFFNALNFAHSKSDRSTSWKEEGRVEGQIEEKLAITLRLLNRKLGNLPEAIA